jgi:hypothetical protein
MSLIISMTIGTAVMCYPVEILDVDVLFCLRIFLYFAWELSCFASTPSHSWQDSTIKEATTTYSDIL